jgi:hypothetical protein
MDIGFLLDRTYGELAQQTWIEGLPEKSFWRGVKTGDRTNIPALTYRCEKCGYLESYANLEVGL